MQLPDVTSRFFTSVANKVRIAQITYLSTISSERFFENIHLFLAADFVGAGFGAGASR
jgi:hypothetical protein